MSKTNMELWIRTLDEIAAELMDAGLSETEAYEAAAAQTDARYRDRLADMIDQARMERKEKDIG